MGILSLPVHCGEDQEHTTERPYAHETSSLVQHMTGATPWKIMALMVLSAVTVADARAADLAPGKRLEERVDLVEINHFYDDQGRLVFDQILYYDWSSTANRYQLRDWRLLKNRNQVPLKNATDGRYVSVWSDFKERDALRSISARLLRETWTEYDPELIEREFLPEGSRKKLRSLATQADPPKPTSLPQKSPTKEFRPGIEAAQ